MVLREGCTTALEVPELALAPTPEVVETLKGPPNKHPQLENAGVVVFTHPARPGAPIRPRL